ncbi:MAG: FHIPEP family type III secretion protein [Nitrospiraceae bacterium]
MEIAKSEVMPAHVLAIDPERRNAELHTAADQGACSKAGALGTGASAGTGADGGLHGGDPGAAIATHLSELIKRHAHELLGRQEAQSLLDQLAKIHPKLVEEVIPGMIPLGSLVRILAQLCEKVCPFAICVRLWKRLQTNARRPRRTRKF